MALPLIGAAARAAAKKLLSKKGGKNKDGQMNPDDVEDQYQRYKRLREKGYNDPDKTKQERLSIVDEEAKKEARGNLKGKVAGAVAGAVVTPPLYFAAKETAEGLAESDRQDRKKEREAEDEIKRETRGMKKGGSVAPSKKVLAKSGFYDKGKTKSEREKIVGKVTTKPQRVKMVEKMLSTKKMKSGGSVSKRADGVAIKGKTRGKMV